MFKSQLQWSLCQPFTKLFSRIGQTENYQEELEDTKGVIRMLKSKKYLDVKIGLYYLYIKRNVDLIIILWIINTLIVNLLRRNKEKQLSFGGNSKDKRNIDVQVTITMEPLSTVYKAIFTYIRSTWWQSITIIHSELLAATRIKSNNNQFTLILNYYWKGVEE
jgi:hypothetical protein